MLQFPLLSDAYAAALLTASAPHPDSVPETEPGPLPQETPDPKREDGGAEDDDMETARTRPLRFDRIHL